MYPGRGGFPAPAGGRGGYYGPPPPVMGGSGQFPPRGPPMHLRGGASFAPPHVAASAGSFAPPHVAFVPPTTATTLPAGWTEHFTPQGVRYYYNAATGVSTYEAPTASGASNGTTATPVAATPTATWIEYKDEASGQMYYYNTITKATVWDQPEEFRIQQARAQVQQMQTSTAADFEVVDEERKRREQKKRETEEKMSQKFDEMSKEERVAEFKAFLEEKQISPQLKWQEAVRLVTKEGLENDPRWKLALSTVGEKKQAYSEYCTQAINKQNIERRRQAKRVREEFLELLAEGIDVKHSTRVTWEDVNDGPTYYGLRKDARWSAVGENKDRKDLFESFLQDLERQQSQQAAKKKAEIKELFINKLRTENKPIFVGKRRLDGDLKKKAWDLIQELCGEAEDTQRFIQKSDVFEWTEDFLDALKQEENELWKAEREKRKEAEDALGAKIEAQLDEWIHSERIRLGLPWKEIHAALADQLSNSAPEQEPQVDGVKLSDRRQRRILEKKIKLWREKIHDQARLLQPFLDLSGFVASPVITYEAFTTAVSDGIRKHIESNGPEEGESMDTEEEPLLSEPSDLRAQVERIVRTSDPSQAIEYPAIVKSVFYLLQSRSERDSLKSAENGDTRDRSVSPSPGSRKRKRRRSSGESPSRYRSRSRSVSRPRSRSRSPHRSSGNRHRRDSRSRSRSRSRDPRAALAMPSYGNLPHHSHSSASGMNGGRPLPVDESARAEEIIRQARLKMLAKQKDPGEESELEEGEELEDGEVEEE
ncbi:hypothetical protein Poli38472_001635 [Pythium oligandrum]|uniref:WW domain-containing protein n=1 Tax=Pythium oligandrum TaxID=41045 RepID=A0A8K1FQJ2_PYTOL|nr:hypothetical protein Poli38472_001635 [Pythium oligandrum]|eukprot:TMW69479.1 hypothetical protein Poli38472_001635 [Pythium oligandrum]